MEKSIAYKKTENLLSNVFLPRNRNLISVIWELTIFTMILFSTWGLLAGNSQDGFSIFLSSNHDAFVYSTLALVVIDWIGGLLVAQKKYKLPANKSRTRYLYSWVSIFDILAIVALLGPSYLQFAAMFRMLYIIPAIGGGIALTILGKGLFREWKSLLVALISTFAVYAILATITLQIATLDPASFNGDIDSYWDAFYFTFITASTIGFGDITPMTAGAQAWTIFIGLVGLLTIAIITAILVYGVIEEYGDYKNSKGNNPRTKLVNLEITRALTKEKRKYYKEKVKKELQENKVRSIYDVKDRKELESMTLKQLKYLLENDDIYFPESLNEKKKMIGFIDKYILPKI